MKLFIRFIEKASNLFGYASGFLMLLGVVLVITEVIARSAFDSTIYITEEYTAYFMVAITFFGLAYTLKEKGHIRMTFLHKLIKGKHRCFLDMYTFLVGFAVFAFITVATFYFFWDSLVSGSRSMSLTRTYLAIPQITMPIGSLLITLQFIAEFLKSIIRLQTGNFDDESSESEALGR